MSSINALPGSELNHALPASYRLFQAYGIELEYMLVHSDTLDVAPVLAEIFKKIHGSPVSDLERGDIEISNELVSHVAEFKCAAPFSDLVKLEKRLYEEVQFFNREASKMGVKLMPGGMHPWMNPEKEMKLWEQDHNEIYETYNRIFGCKGHGWSNLQSAHINLPFSGQDEFSRLHAAIRIVLPIIPALAASSPFANGKFTGYKDYRLNVYKSNQAKVPEITGQVIPEPFFTFNDYHKNILERIYTAIDPLDPEKILQEEWLNSRGAIARFDRNAIEIRLVDSQESVKADMAVAFLIIETVKALEENVLSSSEEQREASQEILVSILNNTISEGENTVIDKPEYLRLFGLPGKKYKAGEVWQNIFERLMFSGKDSRWQEPLNTILREGTLATRILKASGPNKDRESLKEVYARICDCLNQNTIFSNG